MKEKLLLLLSKSGRSQAGPGMRAQSWSLVQLLVSDGLLNSQVPLAA